MEALTVLSKLIGCYERWQEILKPYTLHWTNGNESLQALQTFFDNNLTRLNVIYGQGNDVRAT
jgi:hypothetical protein